MSVLSILITLSIILVEATDPPVKQIPYEKPFPPIMAVPTVTPVKPSLSALGGAHRALGGGPGAPGAFVGDEEKQKLWVKYVAVTDVKKGSNDTIFGLRSGRNRG